jgi:hypothetical protein
MTALKMSNGLGIQGLVIVSKISRLACIRVWAYSSEVLLPASLSSEVVGHKVVKFGPVYEV